MPYGRGDARERAERDRGLLSVVNPGDPSRVPAFEMQREAARGYRVNKRVQSAANARLAATNTFRQRLPPYAAPRVRGRPA